MQGPARWRALLFYRRSFDRASLRPPRGAARLRAAALLAALAAAFALAYVRYSLRHGRLMLPPRFDDVGYLLDAASRLESFYASGAVALLREVRTDAPVAPWASLEAFCSFLLFGIHDWAPYVGNAALIFIFLALAYRLSRGLRPWHRAAVLLLVMSAPLTGYAAMTCRPDFAAAVLLTAGIFTLLGRPDKGATFVRAPTRRKAAAGALFGLAVLARPAALPADLAVLANCLLAATARDALDPSAKMGWRARGPAAARRELARAWAACLLPALLVAGPYFLVGGRRLLKYLRANPLGADAGFWKPPAGSAGRLARYVAGPIAEAMFGSHREALIGLLLIGAAFYAMRRRRREWLRAGAFVWVVLTCYAVCAANPVKDEFLGLTFQVPLVYLAVLTLRNLVFSQRLRRRPPWAEALLVAVVVVRLGSFYWPGWIGRATEPAVRAQWDLVESLYGAVGSHWPPPPTVGDRASSPRARRPRVLFTFTGHVNSTLLNYLAVQRLKPMHCYEPGAVRTPEAYYAAFETADFVIACDSGAGQGLSPAEAGLVAESLPEAALQDRLLESLRSRKDYVPAARFEYPTNRRSFYVFRRTGGDGNR